jgi:hypothetical protein
MSPLQEKLYWREWGAVHKADPSIDRHELHIAALGEDKSHKHFTNEEFDKVLGQMRAISRPTDLAGQIRQLNQKKTRLIWKICTEQLTLLSVYQKNAYYVYSVALDKFPSLRGGSAVLTSSKLQEILNQLEPDQLEHLRSTLAQRINDLRRKAGHTIHDMRKLACLPCECRICIPRAQVVITLPKSDTVPF